MLKPWTATMNNKFLETVIYQWLQQGPQTFTVILDRVWDINDQVGFFEVIEAISTISRANKITADKLSDFDTKYTLEAIQ